MRLLLDTHTFLWLVNGSPELSANASQLISDTQNQVWLSIASVWELAIKISINKLRLVKPLDSFVAEHVSANNLFLLDVEIRHAQALSGLPLHHRDPFDRMIIAQAMIEQMPIVSVDETFDSYPITRLW